MNGTMLSQIVRGMFLAPQVFQKMPKKAKIRFSKAPRSGVRRSQTKRSQLVYLTDIQFNLPSIF